MTINTGKYTMTLNDDAIPSVDQCEAWVDRIIPPTWRTLKKKPGGGRRGGND